jgi:hypothetical protein
MCGTMSTRRDATTGTPIGKPEPGAAVDAGRSAQLQATYPDQSYFTLLSLLLFGGGPLWFDTYARAGYLLIGNDRHPPVLARPSSRRGARIDLSLAAADGQITRVSAGRNCRWNSPPSSGQRKSACSRSPNPTVLLVRFNPRRSTGERVERPHAGSPRPPPSGRRYRAAPGGARRRLLLRRGGADGR